MMMNSYRPNKSRTGRLVASTAFVIFLFLLDVFTGGSIRHGVRGAALSIARGASRLGASVSHSEFFATRAALEAQNRSLADQLAQFEEKAAGYEALRSENEQLRSLVHLAGSAREENLGVTAPVISSVRTSPYGTFLIGAGEADGIARGSLVLTSTGFVIGTVTDLSARTAVVKELFAPNSSIDANIGSATVPITGSGGGNARAKVPRALPVRLNQAVFAPEMGARPIGIVGMIASSSASASQDIFISLPANLASIPYVYILPRSN